MKSGNPRKEINKAIQERLASGERKADIFKYLQTQFDNIDFSAFLLAQWPYPEQCNKYRNLNRALIAVLVAVAIVKVLGAGLFILSEILKAIPLLLLIPLINIYLIYLVAKFNSTGYALTVLFGVLALGKMAEGLPDDPLLVDVIVTAAVSLLVLVAIVLAVMLRRRLLPDTTFFMRPRKDEAGQYIF